MKKPKVSKENADIYNVSSQVRTKRNRFIKSVNEITYK